MGDKIVRAEFPDITGQRHFVRQRKS